jgi:hypothetical protein
MPTTPLRALVDIALLMAGGLLLAAALLASGLSKSVFLEYFGAEDSFTEDLTAAALICAGVVLAVRALRSLGFEIPEYFQERNDQQEVTCHNLVIGDVKLDEVIFGPILSVVILSYLILFPPLWRR